MAVSQFYPPGYAAHAALLCVRSCRDLITAATRIKTIFLDGTYVASTSRYTLPTKSDCLQAILDCCGGRYVAPVTSGLQRESGIKSAYCAAMQTCCAWAVMPEMYRGIR